MNFRWLKNMGPGPLIAAAFIGPGTVTVCTLAGAGFGFSLLWAMLLSVFATIVLQEMSARLGVVTQKGLSEILRTEVKSPFAKFLVIFLVLIAIVVGNAAYEAGNITGSVLGLERIVVNQKLVIGNWSFNLLSVLVGAVSFILLYLGNYKFLEKTLISLVILMSIAFFITAVITKPNIIAILKGAFIPNLTSNNLFLVIGLIGTTVVPYNLFLHAALVKEKWRTPTDLELVRKDTIIAVGLGGLVSMCIIVSAAAIQGNDINSVNDLAIGLEPLFGGFAKYFLAIGLFAAGLTSAITAPLATAYVVTGCLGWSTNLRSTKFKLIWMLILLLGVLFSFLDYKPIEVIKFAQVANGIMLPIIAIILIWIMNNELLLKCYKNTVKNNILGLIALLIILFIAIATLSKIFNLNLL